MKGVSTFTRSFALALVVTLVSSTLRIQAAPTVQSSEPPHPRHESFTPPIFLPGTSPTTLSQSVPDAPSIFPWSQLTFQRYTGNGSWNVYISNDDGSGQTAVTNDGFINVVPRFIRGAQRIAFASNRTGAYELFTVNPDGFGMTQLTFNDTDDVEPFWSPDGTKIVFEAYRDGQAEIYTMNADGSNQTRLTFNTDNTNGNAYDGQPSWSPDGTKLAFISKRTGGYRVWTMNTDGSNPIQLSTQVYSFHPVWSPDGSQIAYDSDGNGDGWQELWLMNADGMNQHSVYVPGAQVDAWARSWSPNSQYVAFTQITFVYIDGVWYWTTAYPNAWDSATGGIVNLSGSGVDWAPDWQTTDIAAPVATMTALPSQSPGPFTVSWSGYDVGAAGIKSYDIQVKDGVAGAWTDWLFGTFATSASYPGIGGHTYYFHVRGQDNAGNVEAWPASHDSVTTVEALPPVSVIRALSPYVRDSVTVEWNGSDPGGSAIQSYDVQYRDGLGGVWADWQMGATVTSTTFEGTLGHTYYFRSRARDTAQNLEDWPAGDGDTQTTFYAWAVSGTAHDNSGAPVVGVNVTTEPNTQSVIATDLSGLYSAYVITSSNTYTASWNKSSYGGLPSTVFTSTSDAQLDVFLPPADNLIQDWGFESGVLSTSAWIATGVLSPVVTSTLKNTGSHSAWMGGPLFAPEEQVASGIAGGLPPAMLIDTQNIIHVMWQDYSTGVTRILYAKRGNDQVWSPPQDISNTSDYASTPILTIDRDGRVHAIWTVYRTTGYHEVVYTQLDSDSAWSSPITVANLPGWIYITNFASDANGNLHALWLYDSSGTTNYAEIYYLRRSADGVWSAPQNVSNLPDHSIYPTLAIDNAGTVHVAWLEYSFFGPADYYFYYAHSESDEGWSAPVEISKGEAQDTFQLRADNNGVIHAAYSFAGNVYYWQIFPDGVWSTPTDIGLDGFSVMDVEPHGTVHFLGYLYGQPSLYHIQRSTDGSWLAEITPYINIAGGLQAIFNEDGSMELAWSGSTYLGGVQYIGDIYYGRRYADGAWSSPINISKNTLENAPGETHPALALGSNGAAHMVWSDYGIVYVGSYLSPQTSDSSLAQSVALPVSITAPILSFLYNLEGASATGNTAFSLQVNNGFTSTTVFSTTASAGNWKHQWFDMSAWSGQAVTLTFSSHQVISYPYVRVALDEVSLGSSYPDLWVSQIGTVASPPGGQVNYYLTYGNQGGATANSVQITDTLPAGLSFVSASLPPVATGSTLVWDVGDLAAKSEAFTLVVTATVDPTATTFSTLTNTMDITTATTELETANNTAQAATFVGRRTYLPVIWR
jgi:uncharacterized repeat protein (TIGR01451 family)